MGITCILVCTMRITSYVHKPSDDVRRVIPSASPSSQVTGLPSPGATLVKSWTVSLAPPRPAAGAAVTVVLQQLASCCWAAVAQPGSTARQLVLAQQGSWVAQKQGTERRLQRCRHGTLVWSRKAKGSRVVANSGGHLPLTHQCPCQQPSDVRSRKKHWVRWAARCWLCRAMEINYAGLEGSQARYALRVELTLEPSQLLCHMSLTGNNSSA